MPANQYGLAGTSTTPTNADGWAEIAANLAMYSNEYVEIEFVLQNSDSEEDWHLLANLVGILMISR